MLRSFNIKIDNPLVFMEQTTMKQFILGDEKGKYEILMDAMNFKTLQQYFDTTEKQLSSMHDHLRMWKEVELKKKEQEFREVLFQIRKSWQKRIYGELRSRLEKAALQQMRRYI